MGLGSAGLSGSPTLPRGSAQHPPGPCTGGEMRRGSLADSGTIICPLQRENKLERASARTELRGQLCDSSSGLPDPGGNPELLGSPAHNKASPSSSPLRRRRPFRDPSPTLKHPTPHRTICLLAQKPWGGLYYILSLCGPVPSVPPSPGISRAASGRAWVLRPTWGPRRGMVVSS